MFPPTHTLTYTHTHTHTHTVEHDYHDALKNTWEGLKARNIDAYNLKMIHRPRSETPNDAVSEVCNYSYIFIYIHTHSHTHSNMFISFFGCFLLFVSC